MDPQFVEDHLVESIIGLVEDLFTQFSKVHQGGLIILNGLIHAIDNRIEMFMDRVGSLVAASIE